MFLLKEKKKTFFNLLLPNFGHKLHLIWALSKHAENQSHIVSSLLLVQVINSLLYLLEGSEEKGQGCLLFLGHFYLWKNDIAHSP